jgi:mono/diheme cytochrome c family protein
MSTHEIILAIVCAVLVVFSLTVALVVPKRNQSFPRSLRPFFLVAAVLVAGMLTTVEVIGGDEKESEAAAATEPAGTGATETGGGQTGATETSGATETTGGAAPGDPVAGKQVFESAGCVSCHTLADAGATGTVGPNLDQAKPPYALVIDRVTHGKGPMPAFGDQGILNEKQIQDVAAYVVQATSG